MRIHQSIVMHATNADEASNHGSLITKLAQAISPSVT
jgi:hypothetical protein